jgi:hypothetical protein
VAKKRRLNFMGTKAVFVFTMGEDFMASYLQYVRFLQESNEEKAFAVQIGIDMNNGEPFVSVVEVDSYREASDDDSE